MFGVSNKNFRNKVSETLFPKQSFRNCLPATNNAAVVKLAAGVSCSDIKSFGNKVSETSEILFRKFPKLFWYILDLRSIIWQSLEVSTVKVHKSVYYLHQLDDLIAKIDTHTKSISHAIAAATMQVASWIKLLFIIFSCTRHNTKHSSRQNRQTHKQTANKSVGWN